MEVVSPASTLGDTLSPPLPLPLAGSQTWKSVWMVEVSMDGGSQHRWWKSAWMVLADSCGATGKA